MKFEERQAEVLQVLKNWSGPICVAYSGGKDSSVVVKLVLNAIKKTPSLASRTSIIYCDTRVENPVLDGFVKRTLKHLKSELRGVLPGLKINILSPELHQRYFVRIAGRGYPPPTTFFRWCTKDLRIRPVQKFISRMGDNPLVIVGTRRGESHQRDRVLKKAGASSHSRMQRQMDGGANTQLYLPILDFDLEDVWDCLVSASFPISIDIDELVKIYRDGGGECPVIRDVNDKPCGSARFGCWTCTVVRRDRSAENMLKSGYDELRSYNEFRNWIAEFRNDNSTRCIRRRNGSDGLGPFTLKARKEIFRRVRALEKSVGRVLINAAEEARIKEYWREDQKSEAYNLSDPDLPPLPLKRAAPRLAAD
jgi:DNA sulfur modification protein DndC